MKTLLLAAACLALVASPLGATPTTQRAKSKGSSLAQSSIAAIVAERGPIETLGATVANIHDFDSQAAVVLRTELKMNDRLQVLSVTEDSPAARIGLEPGDVIMELNGIYVPKGHNAAEQLAARVLPQIDWSQPLRATVLRNGFAQLLAEPDAIAIASTNKKKSERAQ